MVDIPNQFIWDDYSKKNFRNTLRSTEITNKLSEFINFYFSHDLNGVNDCVSKFQNILINTSKKCLKIKKSKLKRKISNVAQKKWFDKECRMKRHHLRKLSNLKHRHLTNADLREKYHEVLKSYKEILQTKKN
jgi:uncharacterized membrane protein YgaE (UPF0421/DUF939 family)